MSPLAEAVYDLLRLRVGRPEPRLTYRELAEQLRDRGEAFEAVHHRGRELYSALEEVGRLCRRLGLPPLPALVVRADTRRPGAAYYTGKCAGTPGRKSVADWRRDLEAVTRATYPAREGP